MMEPNTKATGIIGRVGAWLQSGTASSKRHDPRYTTTKKSWSPLGHPTWWALLALLVLNDHYLKGSGLLPELVTGKLSDVAGLFVAPLLLVAMLSAETRLARALCFLLVAVPFAAINVSPEAAGLLERATAMIGVPWSVFVDPTDLLAFAVYPLAWRFRPTVARRRVELAGLLVGAVACAASGGPAFYSTQAYLINRTEDPIEVRLRRVEADIDCEAVKGKTADVFSLDVFSEGSLFSLEAEDVLPLERTRDDRFDEDGRMIPLPACDAVLVQIDGLRNTVVFWDDRAFTNVPPNLDGKKEEDFDFDTTGMLVIEGERSALTRRSGEGLEVADLTEEATVNDCPARAPISYGWSELPGQDSILLEEIRETDDGCMEIDVEGIVSSFYLCMPISEFPFEVGDSLLLNSFEQEEPAGRGLSLKSLTATKTVELTLWSGEAEGLGIDNTARAVDRNCGGRRLDCGSYAMPAAIELEDGSRIAPGSALEWRTDDDQHVRMVVGRAEHVFVGASQCDPGWDTAGYLVDALFVTREEKR